MATRNSRSSARGVRAGGLGDELFRRLDVDGAAEPRLSLSGRKPPAYGPWYRARPRTAYPRRGSDPRPRTMPRKTWLVTSSAADGEPKS